MSLVAIIWLTIMLGGWMALCILWLTNKADDVDFGDVVMVAVWPITLIFLSYYSMYDRIESWLMDIKVKPQQNSDMRQPDLGPSRTPHCHACGRRM